MLQRDGRRGDERRTCERNGDERGHGGRRRDRGRRTDRGPAGRPGPRPLGVRTLADGVLSLQLAAGGACTLMLVAGTLDDRCAPELPEALYSAARACPGGLALDLRAVVVCDEAGVAALARAGEYARRAGHAVGLAASTPDLDRLMVLTDTLHLVADHLCADRIAARATV
ncbi:STAS domain-containing protein [Streptomyces sp. NRRL B-24484]|uniref:STAS domain-containing protein n=1 Tax=Streptomyces sp. NRRL B-24484 TaxID=1463833 RepID=UPI000693B18A|nr:STAS domain-containing protein [Streptomyces sp. NRRL B-24484]